MSGDKKKGKGIGIGRALFLAGVVGVFVVGAYFTWEKIKADRITEMKGLEVTRLEAYVDTIAAVYPDKCAERVYIEKVCDTCSPGKDGLFVKAETPDKEHESVMVSGDALGNDPKAVKGVAARIKKYIEKKYSCENRHPRNPEERGDNGRF